MQLHCIYIVKDEDADTKMKLIFSFFSMDKDGTLKVDWNEWRNYLLLHPSSDLRDIYAYWRHATVSTQTHHAPSQSHLNTVWPICDSSWTIGRILLCLIGKYKIIEHMP